MRKLLQNPLRTNLKKLTGNSQNSSSIILVRHAESLFNSEISKLKQFKNTLNHSEYEDSHHKIRFNQDLIDCSITENGKMQCQTAGQELKKNGTQISHVIVSPLKRCLMTAENIINEMGHKNPNFKPPQFVVHPLIFEKIEDSCDLIQDIEKNMKLFSYFDWNMFKGITHAPIYQYQYCDVYPPISGINNYYEHGSELLKKPKNITSIESSFKL